MIDESKPYDSSYAFIKERIVNFPYKPSVSAPKSPPDPNRILLIYGAWKQEPLASLIADGTLIFGCDLSRGHFYVTIAPAYRGSVLKLMNTIAEAHVKAEEKFTDQPLSKLAGITWDKFGRECRTLFTELWAKLRPMKAIREERNGG